MSAAPALAGVGVEDTRITVGIGDAVGFNVGMTEGAVDTEGAVEATAVTSGVAEGNREDVGEGRPYGWVQPGTKANAKTNETKITKGKVFMDR